MSMPHQWLRFQAQSSIPLGYSHRGAEDGCGRGFNGAEGDYRFDGNGDGLRGYNIVRNDNGKIVFERRSLFDD